MPESELAVPLFLAGEVLEKEYEGDPVPVPMGAVELLVVTGPTEISELDGTPVLSGRELVHGP